MFWQVKTLLFHHVEPGTECILFDGREGSPRLGRTSVVSHICCVEREVEMKMNERSCEIKMKIRL